VQATFFQDVEPARELRGEATRALRSIARRLLEELRRVTPAPILESFDDVHVVVSDARPPSSELRPGFAC
jgi:hypothetical protein